MSRISPAAQLEKIRAAKIKLEKEEKRLMTRTHDKVLGQIARLVESSGVTLEQITAADVRLMKEKHPGLPVVTYVNTSADVKAESDTCCTSGNAVKVVEAIARDFGTDTVIMIPDKYLARNVAARTGVKVITWEGACEVHERFTAQEIRDYRAAHPGIVVLAHPECPPEVVAEADFAGSTAAMIGST
mgnify:CR=1 FL=1